VGRVGTRRFERSPLIQQRIKGLSVVWYFAKKVLYLRPTIILLNV